MLYARTPDGLFSEMVIFGAGQGEGVYASLPRMYAA
jgi:hypothetical protein